jgi:hypothetical protein|tara:strand:- start:344 stop:577 length:234 start_codon:yes stop_codon:yes gene_type:complete
MTDAELDTMTQVERIRYFKSLNLGHNAAISVGCATTPERRAWELRLARGERAAAVADDPNEVTRELDGARDDLAAQQ